jgi:hypothetical protein
VRRAKQAVQGGCVYHVASGLGQKWQTGCADPHRPESFTSRTAANLDRS